MIYCIGIVRGNSSALKHMIVNDGFKVLIRALQTPIEKLQAKSAFLLSALCNKEDTNRVRGALVVIPGLIEQSAAILSISNVLPETRYDIKCRFYKHLTFFNKIKCISCLFAEIVCCDF